MLTQIGNSSIEGQNSTSKHQMQSSASNTMDVSNNEGYYSNKKLSFHMRFKNLENFLTQLTQGRNDEHPEPAKTANDSADFLAKARAKEYFTNSAHEIISAIQKALETDAIYFYMPMSHLDSIINEIKQELTANYDKVLETVNKRDDTNEIMEQEKKQEHEQNFSENSSTVANQNQNQSNNQIKSPSQAPMLRKSKKGKTKIPKRALLVLKNWLTEHFNDPYPSHHEKVRLSKEADVTLKQVQNWFTNARGRIWRKTCNQEKFATMIEERLKENETKTGDTTSYKMTG